MDKGSLLVLPPLGMVFGLWEAYNCAAIRFGYAAGYSYLSAVTLAVGFCIIGIPLLIYWRVRWIGAGLVLLGVLSCATFYLGMAVLLKTDRVAWLHEPPPVSIGPDQQASVVIYFRKGITDEDVEDFRSSLLEQPAEPRHAGRGYPPFVSEYLRLGPDQANGYEAISLSFFSNASTDQANAYVTKIKADKRVLQVFLNRSPNSIHSLSDRP